MNSDDLNNHDRKTRLSKLHIFDRANKGTPERDKHDSTMNRMWAIPDFRGKIKEMHKKAIATIQAQQESGGGYPSDIALREFQMEYNHRLMLHGTTYMPASFDITEAFFKRTTEFAGLLLHSETDYLINFTDFLDYITSPDSPPLDIGVSSNLTQNHIVNVNSLDVPGEFLLETDNGHGFSILGASYIRRGDEISMLMVIGEQMPETEIEKLRQTATEPSLIASNKPDLSPADDSKAGIVFIDEEKRLVRDIALCRFNIKEKRLDARCILQDMGSKYILTMDVPEVFQCTADRDTKIETMTKKLDKVGVVWELAKILLLLPAYLDARVTFKRTEQRRTKFGLHVQNSLKYKRSVADALPESKVVFRRISAIRIETPRSLQYLTGRSFTPPKFQVQVAGFWRIFSDSTKLGHDEHGNPIVGKTWVQGHFRHKDKPEAPGSKVVYIKSSLSVALRKVEQYRATIAYSEQAAKPIEKQATRTPSGETDLPTIPKCEEFAGAYLYVMRCPAHGRDIYKVGYTDRDPEQRARELSNKTGTPTPFLVVQAWAVSNGRLAERAAHQALDRCRVDSNREFFQAMYSTLRQVLEAAILPWLL
jgi:hypothetical protein